MGKYVIGIDLGINNVGWSIIDIDQHKIENMGVRLFSEASKAQDRRGFRSTRRLKKRKRIREHDILNLFSTIDFPSEKTIDSNLLQKRIKGLEGKLEKQDIVNICCYFARHRGYIPFGDEKRELVDLDGKYPCEYEQKLIKECGKYRALSEIIDHTDLVKELNDILMKQNEYYPELSEVLERILDVISRKRKFWEGPGSEKSLTPYGRFRNETDVIEMKQMLSNIKI